MRGKARMVSAYLVGDNPFISFGRAKDRETRRFPNVTPEQIERVGEVVRSMSLAGRLRVYVHSWGWSAWRRGDSRRKGS